MQGDLDFRGRRVLVTGAASGIGAATARAFAARGAVVIATDLVAGDAIEPMDVTDEAAVEAVFARADATDVVHAAGIVAIGTVAEQGVDTFRRVIEVNLVGSYMVGRAAARHLREGGTLTFISSQAGFKTGAAWSAYGAAKAGVNRLVDALAEELAPGIRVNAICPGNVATPAAEAMLAKLAAMRGTTPQAVAQGYERAIPLERFAKAEEIAAVCLWLASPLATYVTGALIPVDGGELSR